jgi:hypothetical protein
MQISLYEDFLTHHRTVCPAAVCDDPDTAKCRHLLSAHSYIQRLVNHPDVLRHAVRTGSIQKKRKEEEAVRKAQLQERFGQADNTSSSSDSPAASNSTPSFAGSAAEGVHNKCCHDTASKPKTQSSSSRNEIVMHILDSDDEDSSPQQRATTNSDSVMSHGAQTSTDIAPAERPALGEKCDKDAGEMDEDDIKDEDNCDIDIPEFDQLGLEWAEKTLLSNSYVKCDRELSGKMVVLMQLMIECRNSGERCLIFSQSVVMLDCVQAFIDKYNAGQEGCERITAFRLDGSTAQQDRQVLGVFVCLCIYACMYFCVLCMYSCLC